MDQTLSVTALNLYIRDLLDGQSLLANVGVRGELSNYKIYPSGHHYFTLKDSESSLKCVMFKSSASRLRFRPENGMGVTVWGRVTVYPRDGAYQLYASQIMPEGTGDLQIAFDIKLCGYFAIITSSAGAAVHDMIRILGKRWPMAKILLLPVRVQGAEAPAEIAGAIRYANEFDVADLIITGRGGGSIEDLWAFNDERVARAIYSSRLPVISAVGHEPDVTISDFVADRRASTPSNAAEIAVPDCREIIEMLAGYEIRASQGMRKQLTALRERLEAYAERRVLTDPMTIIDNRRMEIDRSRERLVSAEERILAVKRQRFVASTASLEAMSPLRVLTRGYAIAANAEGNSIRSVSQMQSGDRIRLRLSDGSADCLVEGIKRSTI